MIDMKNRTVRIPLSQGYFATVDLMDFRRCIKIKWCVQCRDEKGKHYAVSSATVDGKYKKMYLHRFIMDAKKGQIIDHKDGDGLNCAQTNLRFATNSQNCSNKKGGLAFGKYKGVCCVKKHKKWIAQIGHKMKNIHLGTFNSSLDAALAYDEAAIRLHGEFAVINFPERRKKDNPECQTHLLAT